MNISRRDDRHNADLAKEISDSFNRAIGAKRAVDENKTDDQGTGEGPGGEPEGETPHFVVTGDKRDTGRKRRR